MSKRRRQAEARLSQQILNTSEDELALNRAGELSSAQRAALPRQSQGARTLVNVFGLSAIAIGIITLPLLLVALGQQAVFGAADLDIAALLGAISAVLAGAALLARRVGRSLVQRGQAKVETVTGRVLLEADARRRRYWLILPQSRQRFAIAPEVWGAFNQETRYALYLTDNGQQLIAVEELETLPPLTASERLQQLTDALPRWHSLRRGLRRRQQALAAPQAATLRRAYRADEQDWAQNALGVLTWRQRWRMVRQTLRDTLIFTLAISVMAVWVIAIGLLSGNALAPEAFLAYGFGGFFLALLVRREWRIWQRLRQTLRGDFRLESIEGELTAKTFTPTVNGGVRYTAFIAGEAVSVSRSVYETLTVGNRYRVNFDPRSSNGPALIPLRAVVSLEHRGAAAPVPERATRLTDEAVALAHLLDEPPTPAAERDLSQP